MPTTPPERFEFLSREWVDGAGACLEAALGEAEGLSEDARFSLCETFTDAPPHLADAHGRVSWHARIAGRSVEVDVGAIDDSDLQIRADYQAAIPTALTQHGVADDAVARVQRETAFRSDMDFEMTGGPPSDPAVWPVLGRLHDELAARTVDNTDLEHRIGRLGLTEQAAQLAEQGYCVLERAITEEFADELRAAIVDRISENEYPTPAAMLLERGRIFEEAALHPWLLALAEATVGKGFLLAQLLGSTRGQGPGQLPLHSDYNLVREPFPEYGLNCTACWALEDWTADAGPTVVVPGSNLEGRHPDPATDADGRVPIEMPKGSIVMWVDATWHAQSDRTIPGERIVLHQTFSRLTLRPYDDYKDIDPAILDRNPPVLTTMCGRDDIFEKNRYSGPDFERGRWTP